MINIAVLGIGGTGGYFGGFLARHYRDSEDIRICLIARGKNEEAIRKNGLQLQTTKGNFTIHPHLVTSKPEAVGDIDILLCCTKAYDLEESLKLLERNISNNSIIIPILNGVDNSARVSALFPDAKVWKGCAYIVSRLTSPGHITESGTVQRIHFGSENESPFELLKVQAIFQDAGLDVAYKPDIEETLWKKFIFISAVGTLTSALDLSLGRILENETYKSTLEKLVKEVHSLATVTGISLPGNTVQETIATAVRLPYNTTSSMQNDFANYHRTELESLTGYVVRESAKYGLEVPEFAGLYEQLKKKTKGSDGQ